MAWGFLGTARQILSSYWQYMVRPDGGVKYLGGAIQTLLSTFHQ